MMKQKILDFVNKHNHVSFAELSLLDGFSGDQNIGMQKYNIVYWSDVSEDAAKALTDLIEEGSVKLNPCSPLIYLSDGAIMKYPLAKSKKTYKSPHWLPMVLAKP